MNQPTAISLKNKLSEALISRPSNLVKSFQILNRGEENILSKFSSKINGVALGQSNDNDYFVRLLASTAVNNEEITAISDSLNLPPNDIRVQEIGNIHFFNNPIRHRVRPVPPGASIGHFQVTAGTFGCLVQDRSQQIYILSNNHVLANENRARLGDAILQPGTYDGGGQNDVFARLRTFVPFDYNGFNQIDAALATPDDYRFVTNMIPILGQIRGIVAPRNGMRVAKYGRTTGLTYGEIISRDSDIKIDFESGVINFENQLEVVTRDGIFSAPGDSGSLIVEVGTNLAVGLLFAGSDSGVTFANPISNVLQAFDVNII